MRFCSYKKLLFFLQFLSRSVDVYSWWTSQIIISLSLIHTESRNMSITSVCSDLTVGTLEAGTCWNVDQRLNYRSPACTCVPLCLRSALLLLVISVVVHSQFLWPRLQAAVHHLFIRLCQRAAGEHGAFSSWKRRRPNTELKHREHWLHQGVIHFITAVSVSVSTAIIYMYLQPALTHCWTLSLKYLITQSVSLLTVHIYQGNSMNSQGLHRVCSVRSRLILAWWCWHYESPS